MTETTDITLYSKFVRLKKIYASIKEISFQVSQAEKRYPAPESMTKEELNALIKVYLALGFDLEELVKEWKRVYKR